MGSAATRERIPGHLRQYVVDQDYSAYDEIDQQVWRFVLLQTYHMLKESAHPIYTEGLKQTGIRIDRIPSIQEMDECLGRYGWGAVCVDGFIPPRAFQEFQALNIMTIATEIRTHEHTAYTPAPDIIHESAGHSPIVPDEDYRRFLRRFGELGGKAFSSPEDRRVYEAIRNLSIVKEEPSTPKDVVDAAVKEFEDAVNSVSYTSEASYMSRLHWWTVEYGLVGTPKDFKIYGAGILSSVGETYFLQFDDVKKIPLTADCINVNYDITEKQPQLFVVESFPKLNEVLDEVVEKFAFRIGGEYALKEAHRSGEVCTVEFNSGIQISGKLAELVGEDPTAYLCFQGPCALAYHDKHLPGHERDHHPEGYGTPLGPLEDGTALSELREADLAKYGYRQSGDEVALAYKSGVRVKGKLEKIVCNDDGRLMLLTFKDCRVTRGDRALFEPSWGVFDMAVGESVPTAYAGVADKSYWPSTPFSGKKVPKPKQRDSKDQKLLGMFKEVISFFDKGDDAGMLASFERIHDVLEKEYPNHWLLRWYMLEQLTLRDRGVTLASRLKERLEDIEADDYEELPIGMGLRYLGLSDREGRWRKPNARKKA